MKRQGRKAGFELSIHWGDLPPLKIVVAAFVGAGCPNGRRAAIAARCAESSVTNVGYGALAKAGFFADADHGAGAGTGTQEERVSESSRRNPFDEGIENIMSYQAGVSQTDATQGDEE